MVARWKSTHQHHVPRTYGFHQLDRENSTEENAKLMGTLCCWYQPVPEANKRNMNKATQIIYFKLSYLEHTKSNWVIMEG